MIPEISILYRKMNIYLNAASSSLDLSPSHLTLLVCLCNHKHATQYELCEKLDMDKSTVARALCRMEETGYITRHPKADDCRCLQVFPTQKAWAAYEKAVAIGEEWESLLTQSMSDLERDIFERLLARAAEQAAYILNTNAPHTIISAKAADSSTIK